MPKGADSVCRRAGGASAEGASAESANMPKGQVLEAQTDSARGSNMPTVQVLMVQAYRGCKCWRRRYAEGASADGVEVPKV